MIVVLLNVYLALLFVLVIGVVAALTALRANDLDTTLDRLIEAIRADRFYDDDGARKLGVALFQTLGEGHRVSQAHRPAFNMSLY